MVVNANSQKVQVLGFILLGRMPNARNGTESTPRSGTGGCNCCQQLMQIFAWCTVCGSATLLTASQSKAMLSKQSHGAGTNVSRRSWRQSSELAH